MTRTPGARTSRRLRGRVYEVPASQELRARVGDFLRKTPVCAKEI